MQKLTRYKLTTKPLSLTFQLGKAMINKEEIQRIVPYTINDVWRDGKQYKMKDELSNKMYNCNNVDSLFENTDTIAPAIYWILNYALSQLVVKMDPDKFQNLIIFDLFVMLKLYEKVTKKITKYTQNSQINMRNYSAAKVLTAFDFTFMRNYVVTLAKIMNLLGTHKTLWLYCINSLSCENTFSGARTNSHYQHDINMARVVFENQRVQDQIEYETGFNANSQGNRIGHHQTTTVEITKKFETKQQERIWELAGYAINLIFYDKSQQSLRDSQVLQNQFKQIKQFWKNIYNSISEKDKAPSKDIQKVGSKNTSNYQAPTSQLRINGVSEVTNEIIMYTTGKKK
ncbi:Conserved_hypothetical protein [Hexamita inflata]|uniref:Uncharacterized protein n=1 Tax=Hexamita inflata TaxID=28002 RepID=A0AA86RIL8_9EUKA|nr:Conserved hypothetical protein [Hexamita inflata]